MRRSGSWPFALPGASGPAKNARIGEAAWIARCVGRGTTAPMTTEDVVALAESLGSVDLRPGGLLFGADDPSSAGVWIVREGRVELSVGSGRRRVVVGVLRAGDVEGDIPLLLGRPLPYAARTVDRAAGCPASPNGWPAATPGSSGCSAGRCRPSSRACCSTSRVR